MIEPPYIGCALTIIDPGPKSNRMSNYPRRNRNGSPRLMKVKVEHTRESIVPRDAPPDIAIDWRAGSRSGYVMLSQEGTEWVRGWGPQARDSLLAMRKLVGSAA